MKVVEVFKSIQGEGPSTGRVAYFVRLAGCNLACKWCDTKYSWSGGTDYTMQELKDKLSSLGFKTGDMIVFTGGEPLLQKGEIWDFMLGSASGTRYAMETNGTISLLGLKWVPDILKHWEINISPKLSNSQSKEDVVVRDTTVHPDWFLYSNMMINNYNYRYNINWKFVVATDEDTKEVIVFCQNNGIRPDRVWLMPECTTSERCITLLPSIWKDCVKYGFNLSARLQVIAHGNKKGI